MGLYTLEINCDEDEGYKIYKILYLLFDIFTAFSASPCEIYFSSEKKNTP